MYALTGHSMSKAREVHKIGSQNCWGHSPEDPRCPGAPATDYFLSVALRAIRNGAAMEIPRSEPRSRMGIGVDLEVVLDLSASGMFAGNLGRLLLGRRRVHGSS